MSHPPFAHNPHVYNGIDPDGNPTTGMVVHSHAATEPEFVGEAAPELVHPPFDGPADAVSNEDAPTDVNGDGAVDGYEVFTKAELITECEARGLPVSGNKPDLVARLQEADKTPVADASPAEGGE
jgi:hypothetical protein